MSVNPHLVKESFTHVEPFADNMTAYFYGRLFAEDPKLRALFPAAMDTQRDRIFHALTRIVWSLDSPGTLDAYLSQLGRDHRKFGVCPEHFPVLGRALIATLRKFSAGSWTAEIEEAWEQAYETAAQIMINGATEDPGPAWWIGEVVEHERRSHDIAVFTVRPGTRYPFTAGQHVPIQVSQWPRVWRPYSVANAPQPDGVLRFHVRAVPAGWVSGALVRETRIGDTLLLGPPSGSMMLDPESDRDLLMVAGGTGLAPLKSLIEQVARSERQHDVHLVFGARTERELYDLPDLRRLERMFHWLRVTAVVAQDSRFDGMHGKVPDVLDRFDGWADHDVYISGPPAMIDHTARALQGLGVAPARIHHDSSGRHL